MPIRPFLKDAVFDPNVISVMETAFEDICKALEVLGRTDVTKESVATKIIQIARGGEIHPVVLGQKVLSELGLGIPASLIDNPKHWCDRAEEVRTLAEQMNDPESKSTMLRIAEDYERLATRAQRRGESGSPSK
jgi:hypothetical protein